MAVTKETKRQDGRGPAAMRPPKVVFGPLSRADGSAKFLMGSSSWVAAVYGPKEGPGGGMRAVEKNCGRAHVEVVVRPAAGQVQTSDRCLELAVLKHVETLVVLENFPRMTIQVVAQQQRSDGSDTAVCLNAVWLALLEAGIPMRTTALAVGIGFGKEGLFLDPNYSEEQNLPAGATAVVDCHSADVMSMLPTKGPLPQHHWSTAVCLSQAGVKMLEGFLRQAYAKKLDKLPKC